MKDNMTERFALYLRDVISHYKKNGSLRRYSAIAARHGITSISQELFFKYGLDRLSDGETPRLSICDKILEDIRLKKQRSRDTKKEVVSTPLFKAGQVVSWENKHGVKAISYIGEDDIAWFTLNMFCKEDETKCMYTNKELPREVVNGNWKVVDITKEEYEFFIAELCTRLMPKYKDNRIHTQGKLF